MGRPWCGGSGTPPLVERRTWLEASDAQSGVWRSRLGHLRKDFSLGREVVPIDMQRAPPALVLLIKMENMGLCDAFNHFGIVKSSGLWGLGWPWCEHKLA